ncbi:hypothetical protein [Pedobacter cryoconitis]|uniref:Uncharacterized protein n=1 Tax=Pedobacter cryoconitis TaxID=188932 RepID=A0A7X0J2Z0_9SPHI|nr:hypothetical protein [Pedobacter cryoconitis]MBB6500125.1 hypothetical protein [Pedobacter cryoconitis]
MKKISQETISTMGLEEIPDQELSTINGGISILGVVVKYYAISALSPFYGFAHGLGVAVGYMTK